MEPMPTCNIIIIIISLASMTVGVDYKLHKLPFVSTHNPAALYAVYYECVNTHNYLHNGMLE